MSPANQSGTLRVTSAPARRTFVYATTRRRDSEMAKRKQKSASVAQTATSGTVDSSDPSSPYQKARKRIFQCQFCAKEFHRNEHLQRHERLRMILQANGKKCAYRCQIPKKNRSAVQLALKHLPEGIGLTDGCRTDLTGLMM